MRLLRIFKKNPLTRVELKAHSKNSKFRLRASRTSGLNAAIHPFRGITFNTKHGLRASKTFKGLTLGIQNGNSVVRGRWSSENGLLNLNLSKSGFSLSTKSKYGTFNLTNPNRSSFKFGGIQIRGRNAKGLAFISTVFTLIPVLLKAMIMMPILAYKIFVDIFFALMLIGKVAINILIILSRLMLFIYDVAFVIFIDIPKQIISNVFSKKKLDNLSEEEHVNKEGANEINNKKSKNTKIKHVSYISTYDKTNFIKKILLVLIAGLGLCFMLAGLLIFIMLFIQNIANTTGEVIFVISCGLILIIIGKLLTKPFLKIRRKKLEKAI